MDLLLTIPQAEVSNIGASIVAFLIPLVLGSLITALYFLRQMHSMYFDLVYEHYLRELICSKDLAEIKEAVDNMDTLEMSTLGNYSAAYFGKQYASQSIQTIHGVFKNHRGTRIGDGELEHLKKMLDEKINLNKKTNGKSESSDNNSN